jgi:3-hydroxyacyl-[acyl-carrier-protein] dehydratase
MHFSLVDRVLEASDEAATTIKHVTLAEEYLQDHFPSFPVLPGVLMLEAMVQAGRVVADRRGMEGPLVLGEVRALKYNRFVPPGAAIRSEVRLDGEQGAGTLGFRGQVVLVDPAAPGDETIAASGRFTLRGVRVHAGG